MAKDRLVISEGRNGYVIQWYLADIQDVGASLGDGPIPASDPPPEHEDWEIIVAARAAGNASPDGRDRDGFFWESKAKARAALVSANAALKNKPLVDWEVKALAAGWKPPKGRI